jgi:hypothetical protein
MKVGGLIWLAVVLRAPLAVGAATNSGKEDDLLKLLPPHAELPPTFWEQHGLLVLLAALLLVVLIGIVVWLLVRPKAPVIVPIEIQARLELQALRQQTENGRTLSEVSRVLRRYVAGAFELPPEEMTTAEFCRLLAGQEEIGAELATSVSGFLRRCDELKFAPASSPVPIGAAAQALELVERGEARRTQLRQAALATTVGESVQRS